MTAPKVASEMSPSVPDLRRVPLGAELVRLIKKRSAATPVAGQVVVNPLQEAIDVVLIVEDMGVDSEKIAVVESVDTSLVEEMPQFA